MAFEATQRPDVKFSANEEKPSVRFTSGPEPEDEEADPNETSQLIPEEELMREMSICSFDTRVQFSTNVNKSRCSSIATGPYGLSFQLIDRVRSFTTTAHSSGYHAI